MKLSDLIITANQNLLRNKTRTFLTILAIFIGSFTIILSNAINTGVNDFIDKQVESIGGDGYIEIMPKNVSDQLTALMSGDSSVKEYDPNKGSLESSSISDEDLAAIRAVDGIEKMNAYHMASSEYITSSHTDKKYALTVTLSPDNSLNVDMYTGRQVDSESSDYEIMLTEDYVKPLGFTSNEEIVGKTVTIGVKQTAKCYFVGNPNDCIATINATVTGIQAPGVLSSFGGGARINLALNDAIYALATEGVPKSTADKSYFAIGSADPAKIDQIRQELDELGFTVTTVDDEAGMIRTFFDVILIVFNIFGAIALLAAAIGIINTLFMSVQERTREIGLMKAMGMSDKKIFAAFSFEAISLGFWGSVIGILISMLIGYSVNALAHETFLADFPTFQLVLFSPINMLIITLVIMFIAFIAGTAPAYRASKQNPIDSLRYE
ncbi:ABC transporter permease [Candidatus Saccharibacteria bacterium]|nr:ABC transporter permease [Candidatus Saccharibacteria bacterium]